MSCLLQFETHQIGYRLFSLSFKFNQFFIGYSASLTLPFLPEKIDVSYQWILPQLGTVSSQYNHFFKEASLLFEDKLAVGQNIQSEDSTMLTGSRYGWSVGGRRLALILRFSTTTALSVA